MRYLAALLVATANAADVCSNTQAIDGQQFPDWIKSGGSTRQLTGGGTSVQVRSREGLRARVVHRRRRCDWRPLEVCWQRRQAARRRPEIPRRRDPRQIREDAPTAVPPGVRRRKVAEALKDSLSDKLDAKTLEAFKDKLFGVIADGVNKGTKLYFEWLLMR